MVEEVTRLEPLKDTVRELALKSGNQCAFPGCPRIMMNANGTMLGQICHIEAAERGGQRFRESMTNEQRRHQSNLMLMCYDHHVITNDFVTYTVDVLQKMKAAHEARFTNPDPSLYQLLRDWTQAYEPSYVQNLRKINRVCDLRMSDQDAPEWIAEVNTFIKNFRNVPIGTRHFFGTVIDRIYRMSGQPVVLEGSSSIAIQCTDIEGALRLSGNQVAAQGRQLEAYRLGCLDHYQFDSYNDYVLPGIAIYFFRSGWPFWFDVAQFCQLQRIPLSVLTEDLDFAVLDE